jgi:hypothetical protein
MQIQRTRTYETKCIGITIRDGVVGIQWALLDEIGATVEAHSLDGAEVSPEAAAAIATIEAWAAAAIDAAAGVKQAARDVEIADAIAAKVEVEAVK